MKIGQDNYIDLEVRPKVLLYGNGFAIDSFEDCSSLDKLINEWMKIYNPDITDEQMEELYFPQRVVVATNDKVQDRVTELAAQMQQLKVNSKCYELYNAINKAHFDAILTPNYTNELEIAATGSYTRGRYNRTVQKPHEGGMIKQLIYTNISLKQYGFCTPIWHIHGNAYASRTMILGQYYYAKLLKEIELYIPLLIQRIDRSKKYGLQKIKALSWIDYFLLRDVYIISFSMNPAELDIWYLAECKKNRWKESKIYFFEPEKEKINNTGKKALMETYGIGICTEESFDGDYYAYYLKTLAKDNTI